MPWLCRAKCGQYTSRRPPDNVCMGCRSSKRGRHNLKRPAASDAAGAFTAATRASPAAPTSASLPEDLEILPEPSSSATAAAPAAEPSSAPSPSPQELMPKPSSATLPLPASSATGQEVQDEYEDFCDRMEALLHPLKALFGRVAAYEFLSRAFAVIGRYKEKQVPLPNTCTYSCVSFAMALSGIPDEDEKRRQWFAMVSTANNSRQLRENICMWTMTYP